MLPSTTVVTRQFLDQTFERHGLPRPQVQIESNVLNMILPIIEKTRLMGFVTRFNLRAGRANLREVESPEMTMKRRLGLTWRRVGYMSPVIRRISAILRDKGRPCWTGLFRAGLQQSPSALLHTAHLQKSGQKIALSFVVTFLTSVTSTPAANKLPTSKYSPSHHSFG